MLQVPIRNGTQAATKAVILVHRPWPKQAATLIFPRLEVRQEGPDSGHCLLTFQKYAQNAHVPQLELLSDLPLFSSRYSTLLDTLLYGTA